MTAADDVPAAVLELTGDVDANSVGGFATQAHQLLATADLQRMVVDMGEVSFIDSSGIGLLVQIHTACRRDGIDLELARPTHSTRVLLSISGLSDAFYIRDAPS